MTFHGLASPNELKTTWFNMTEGQDLPDVNVIWEFNEQALKDILENDFGVYVVNCLYKINPNMVGHYVALYKKGNELIYFDPLATFPQKWLIERCFAFRDDVACFKHDRMQSIQRQSRLKIIVDLEGAQAINGNSCGFRCLFKLLKYCLGYMPENYAELYEDALASGDKSRGFGNASHSVARIDWTISENKNKKKFIDTTIKKTKREIKTIKDLL